MTTVMTVLRAISAISALAAGAMVILFWGLGISVWSLVGLAVAMMAFGAGTMAARRYYVQAATPSGLAAVVSIFVWMPPSGAILLAVILLLLTCGLAFYLYEVD
jgi:hypothetical protein